MKTSEKNTPVMEFVFQTIKLDQVATLVPHTYRSKYETIRTQVIERIKAMPGDETFLFQPQDRKTKLTDNLIARICHGINTGLVRENLNWKISFSQKARAFVVAPFKRYKLGKRHEPKSIKPLAPVHPNTHRVTHITELPGGMNDKEREHLFNLIKLTRNHFGKSLKDLQIKLDGPRNPELANLKKAFLYIGRNALGIKLTHLGKLLGMNSSSSTVLCQRAMKDPGAKEIVNEYVKALSVATNQNGGN